MKAAEIILREKRIKDAANELYILTRTRRVHVVHMEIGMPPGRRFVVKWPYIVSAARCRAPFRSRARALFNE